LVPAPWRLRYWDRVQWPEHTEPVVMTDARTNAAAVVIAWILIDWVVALVMACTSHQVAFVQHRN
jgi:hypothetical protein